MTFFYNLNKKLSDLDTHQTLNEGVYQGGPDKSQIPAVNRAGNKMSLQDLEKERTQSPTSAEGMRALQDKLKNIHPMDEVGDTPAGLAAVRKVGQRADRAIGDAGTGLSGSELDNPDKTYAARDRANSIVGRERIRANDKNPTRVVGGPNHGNRMEEKLPMVKGPDGKMVPKFAADGIGKMEEASTDDYSAKKARAGKDIGKPGKNFAKIAKGAAERYGSKAAGERVAGAVLNKLRTKEDIAQEGNRFTGNLAKARAAGLKTADLDGDGDMEQVRESNMVMVGKGTKDGRSVHILHDRQYDEYTINLIDGATQQRVFAEDRDTAQRIARTWLSEGIRRDTDDEDDVYAYQDSTKAKSHKTAAGGTVTRHGGVTRHQAAPGNYGGYDPETDPDKDDDKSGTSAGDKRGRGRPKGTGKRIGAKGPGAQSKLLRGKAIAEQGLEEDYDSDEYDQEGEMAQSQAHTIADAAQELHDLVSTNENLPEWVQKKITLAQEYIDSARDYLKANRPDEEYTVAEVAPPGAKAERMVKGIKKSLSKDGHLSGKDKAIAYATAWKAKKAGKVEEESTDKEDQKAERAGKRVAKDIEHDEGHKGKDDNRAERAGKKVTKDIEYDDKKDRKEKKKDEVEENTVAGSVAPAMGGKAPKGSGGMQFGKGVYEAKLAESFDSKLTTVLKEGMNINMSADQDGKKSLTITATDDDADQLAQILKMSGLGGDACSTCGKAGCGCEQMEEDLANSADKTVYADTDYMVNGISGGLDGRKTDQSTLGTVINQDPRRTIGSVAEEIREQEESRLWNLYKQY